MLDLKHVANVLGGVVHGDQVLCPGPGHSRKDRSLSILFDRNAPDRFIVHSYAGDDIGRCRDHVRSALAICVGQIAHRKKGGGAFASSDTHQWGPAKRTRNRCSETKFNGSFHLSGDNDERASKFRRAMNLWRSATNVFGSPGERYFTEHRGITLADLGDMFHAIRWHAGHGAILALMTDPLTAEPCGVHRTFLDGDCGKRDRTMLGPQGVVRLVEDGEVSHGLGIAEGIEDALSILRTFCPVWAATCAGAMAKFPVLSGVEALTLFADRDEVGIAAAKRCCSRWIDAGREAHVALPPAGEKVDV